MLPSFTLVLHVLHPEPILVLHLVLHVLQFGHNPRSGACFTSCFTCFTPSGLDKPHRIRAAPTAARSGAKTPMPLIHRQNGARTTDHLHHHHPRHHRHMGRRYTDDEKNTALALYADVGPTVAASQTGIPKGTISRWGQAAGIETVSSEKTAAATEAARVRWDQRRSEMAHQIGDAAQGVLDRIVREKDTAKTRDLRDAAIALGTLIDKAQLLSGGATSRAERVRPAKRAAELLDELEQTELDRKRQAKAQAA